MRLSDYQKLKIKEAVSSVLGSDANVILFGSRVDDQQRGGDIDLLIESNRDIIDYVSASCSIAAKIQMKLGEQKIDILMSAPNIKQQPIHRVAKETGVLL